MPRAAHLNKRLVEAIKLRGLELRIVKAKEIVHDDVPGESGKRIG
jgi:hypothetical protein